MSAPPSPADGYEVILDFSMPLAFVRRAAERVSGSEALYVELRPSLEACAAWAASRAEGVIADYGRYRDFYALFDAPESLVIANDGLAPEAAAAAIRAGLAAGRFRLG